jgi:DNA-binding SARP family transcriptional activator/ABC-type oligopeptide transport system substrate-binding subunit/streptogramin lyase
VEFRLLGPLEVWDDGRALELGGQKRRALLALLLLHANEVVSSDRLIEELWGEEPPQAAATALHGHVSRLRKLLGGADGGAGQPLITRPPGYVLQLEPDQLDLHRFERFREEARAARSKGDLAGASGKLRDALALWRGPPLADLAYERFAQVECGRLEELRLATIEERIDVDLALGRHGDVSSELERLVAEHPLREGFRAQLMLALYRSGRQAEALQVYQQGRRVLVEELGIDPSQRLRDLEQAILRQDEALGPPVVPSAPGLAEKRNNRQLLLISAVCAIGGAVALALLVSRLEGGKAAAAFRPGTVLLDLKTKKQIGFLPPSRLLAPGAPVYAHGHVWLLNSSSNSFVELDASTARVLKQFPLPNGARAGGSRTVQPFALDRHALWVGAGDDLVEMDPRIRQEVDRFKLDKLTGVAGEAEGVAVGGGLVWVARDVGFPGQVIAVDPRTRRVRYRFDDVAHDADIAFDDGVVWAADSAGVDVIDPSTNLVTPVRDIETFDPFFGPQSSGNGVAAGGGFGWTTDPAKGLVYKIDRNGRVVDRYRTGLGATGASFGEGAVWVRNEDVGTVSRIDAVTGRQTVYRFGRAVAAEVAGKGVLLAALEPGPTTEERIDALRGNVLRLFSQQGALGQGGEPALNWDLAAGQIEFTTCANLLRYPDMPVPDGLRLRPEVAAGMPSLSLDRRTYTFTIRRGYRFSPPVREPLTAKTFRYSIERALSPNLDGGPAPFYIEDIQGEKAFRNGKARHISGLRAAGNRLSIRLTKPSGDFLERLASPALCPVPPGTPFLAKAANQSVGANSWTIPSAGPYYVADWRDNKYVILKRNPYYRGPRPHKLDAIALREGVDVGVAIDRIRHEGWDGIVSSGHTSTQINDPRLDPGSPLAKEYGGGSPARLQYVPAPLPHTTYLALNAVRGPFADPAVRRAVAFAVDRTAIAPIWDSTPTDQLLPKVTGGFRDRRLYPLRPDLAKARALMHGRRLEAVMVLNRHGDAGLLQEARVLRAELGRIGIQLVLKPLGEHPTDQALDTGHPRIDLMDSGLIDGPDGASFLAQVFLTTVPPSWLTPAVRQAVERVNRLSGRERQDAAGALADRLVVRDVPVVSIGNRAQGELFAPTVGCRIFPPTGAGVDLAALCRRP